LHAQPAPDAALTERPLGIASVIVTVPTVAAGPRLLTTIVYVAPVCPGRKSPVWALLTVRFGPGPIAAGVLPVSLPGFGSAVPVGDVIVAWLTNAPLARRGSFVPGLIVQRWPCYRAAL